MQIFNEKSADFQDCFYISCFSNKSSIILFAANENENYSYDSLIFEVKEDDVKRPKLDIKRCFSESHQSKLIK